MGNPNRTAAPNNNTEAARRIQNSALTSPAVILTITASTSSARVSVIIVPPTAICTARFLATPNLLIKG